MRKAVFYFAIICFASPCVAQAVPSFSGQLLQHAKSGNDAAERAVAYDYYYGRGTHKNLPAAAEWYKISADRGNPSSAANYAVIETQSRGIRNAAGVDSRQLALTYFTKAADAGYVPAYVGIGNLYARQNNYTEAASWYHKAADQNNSLAEFELGRLYLQGKGVPKNEKFGTTLLKKAAKQGNLPAINMIAARHGNNSQSAYYGGFTRMTPMP